METHSYSKAPPSEKEVIIQAQRNLNSFEPLYEKYFNQVFRFVYSKMEREEDAADLTSEVFLKAMKAIASYRISGAPFLSWLLAIARSEVAGYYRKKSSERRYYASQQGVEQIVRDVEYEVPQAFFHIRNLLEQLPESDFDLIDLKYFHKKSVREISDITGMNEGKIRVRMHRIRTKLARLASGYDRDLVLYSMPVIIFVLYYLLNGIR
jgi:RNA polymerase sigma-70 factor, ECF subfamily